MVSVITFVDLDHFKKHAKILNDKYCYISAAGSDLNTTPWTSEEQKLLEQALKTYPVSTPERWEKIAAAVPGRSKKDCMKRYKVITCSFVLNQHLLNFDKLMWEHHLIVICHAFLWQELVEMVKAKKAAQEQVAAKSKKWQELEEAVLVLF